MITLQLLNFRLFPQLDTKYFHYLCDEHPIWKDGSSAISTFFHVLKNYITYVNSLMCQYGVNQKALKTRYIIPMTFPRNECIADHVLVVVW